MQVPCDDAVCVNAAVGSCSVNVFRVFRNLVGDRHVCVSACRVLICNGIREVVFRHDLFAVDGHCCVFRLEYVLHRRCRDIVDDFVCLVRVLTDHKISIVDQRLVAFRFFINRDVEFEYDCLAVLDVHCPCHDAVCECTAVVCGTFDVCRMFRNFVSDCDVGVFACGVRVCDLVCQPGTALDLFTIDGYVCLTGVVDILVRRCRCRVLCFVCRVLVVSVVDVSVVLDHFALDVF